MDGLNFEHICFAAGCDELTTTFHFSEIILTEVNSTPYDENTQATGSEIVPNAGFDNADVWTISAEGGAGSAVSGGQLQSTWPAFNGPSNPAQRLFIRQAQELGSAITVVKNTVYRLSITLTVDTPPPANTCFLDTMLSRYFNEDHPIQFDLASLSNTETTISGVFAAPGDFTDLQVSVECIVGSHSAFNLNINTISIVPIS